ncbi:unnamed protein product, partial [Effrenium voratum]
RRAWRSMRAMWGLLVGGFLLRLLLLPLQLYRSTDFEVHRNWLAVTHSLPMSEWYFEATSEWTLDYPPAFAYFEWLLSQAAARVDPGMLEVRNLEYGSPATVLFQRCSVICGDLILVLGAWCMGGLQAAVLLLWNSGLLVVDHVHFQYNGMLYGLLLLSIAAIESGRVYVGSVLFVLLLCMKHIFLYVAPVFFVFLLRSHCDARLQFPFLHWGRLVKLGLAVLGTLLVLLGPFLQQLPQLLKRLFPFGRGLTHAYWAPNCWALYNTLDRVLAKVVGSKSGSASTAGFAEVYESAVLWTVPPPATFVLTLLAYGPLLVRIWQVTKAESREKGRLALYVALGSAVAFTFGWHVHEKAILMVTVPLMAASIRMDSNRYPLGRLAVALSTVSAFSVMPLLPLQPKETAVKWILFFAGLLVESRCLARRFGDDWTRRKVLSSMAYFLDWQLVVPAYVLLGLYHEAGGHRLLFRGRMEFLPLMLISDVCAVLVLTYFGKLYDAWLILAARVHALEADLEESRRREEKLKAELRDSEAKRKSLKTSEAVLEAELTKTSKLLEAANARVEEMQQERQEMQQSRCRRRSRIPTACEQVLRTAGTHQSLAAEMEEDEEDEEEDKVEKRGAALALEHLAEFRIEVQSLDAATLLCQTWLKEARPGFLEMPLGEDHERQGIVYDKWPFRLDIDTEYQDWILLAVCILVTCIWCLPCICGRLSCRCGRSFSSLVYKRLHTYFLFATYLNVFLLLLTIAVLPDWTVNEFSVYFVTFIDWVLVHVQKLITSLSILFCFYLVFRFRHRIALATGMEHITVIRFSWRDCVGQWFGLGVRKRPIEVFVWKVQELQSASSKITKPNDLFVECHMGFNEPMRTRVHNNAGSQAVIRESFQINIDELAPDTLMTLLVKDQSLLVSSEVARVTLSTRELCGIEDQTGKRRSTFNYSEECFIELPMSPDGKIWMAVAPVDDCGDEETTKLLDDSLMPC